ncbi:ABC transporter substrate-binding protein [Georgenia deserti]|uniref:ABC transporter substrate-binding protein n=1 Tax=Georgenia deserti TaxID=2093781 RepID=A0ABW4KYQ9_9MICO
MSLARPGVAVLAVATALSLAACSGAADTGGAAAQDGGEAGGGDGGTRTVTSPFTGEEVEIPTDPERVVALWRTGVVLADLGVEPVAALEGELLPSELQPEVYEPLAGVPTVGTWEGVDIEELIAADPDLIIGMDNGGLTMNYDEISQVAPTVILDIAEPPDVWANYPTVADLVGRTTDFDERDAALSEDLTAIADDHDLEGLEVTAFSASDGSIWVSTAKSLNYARLDAAGFGYNEDYVDDPERYVTELSAENIADLADQDAIFYEVDIDGSVPPDVQSVLDMESFQQLPAAQAGHVFPLTSGVVYTFDAAQQQVADLRAAAEELSS